MTTTSHTSAVSATQPAPAPTMSFGEAIVLLQDGVRVCRSGWVANGVWIYLVPESAGEVTGPPLLGTYSEGTPISYLPYIGVRTSSGVFVPWVAKHIDILAGDWEEVS